MSGEGTRPGSAEGSPEAVVIRADEAELLTGPTVQIRLLGDSSVTSGALSTQRVTPATGADGAAPHRHKASSELF
jgi:hypothetical protein